MMKNRIADEKIYVDAYYHDKPKEYFKLISNHIIIKESNHTIIDIGCANGALLSYLGKKMPNVNLIGYEPVSSLIKIGKKLDTKIKFINYGLFEIPNNSRFKGDTIISSGVIGIFNNPSLFVKKLLNQLNNQGQILIFSPFNEEPIDVILKYKYSSNKNWEIGHNLFSMRTMENIALKFNLKYEWVEFSMPFKIPKTKDPMRSWTEPFRGNKNCLIYGTNMFSTMKLLILTK